MIELIKYTDFTTDVYQGGDFPLRKNVNGWAVTNLGLDVATVNGMQLLPPIAPNLSGETKGFSGNLGEVYGRGDITIEFKTSVGPHLQVSQKVYAK